MARVKSVCASWTLTAGVALLASTATGGLAHAQPSTSNPTAWNRNNPDSIEGTWRFTGENFRGPYEGVMQVTRALNSAALTYDRRFLINGQLEQNAERGRVLRGGGTLFTQQVVTPGMVTLFKDRASIPQRHGVYRLETPYKASGMSFVAATFERSREELIRQAPDAPNNHVELLVDGRELFPRLRQEIMLAQRSVYVQTFIFEGDNTGRPLAELLMRKAQEGLDVRLLVDAFGDKIGKDLKKDLKASGVKFIAQHGWGEGLRGSLKNIGSGIWNGLKGLFGGTKTKREKRGVFNHDHRKISLVDGRIGFIGGMNISREYETVWHDVHSMVKGDAVEELSKLFDDRWKAAGGKGELAEPAPETLDAGYFPGHMQVEVVETIPGLKLDIFERYRREIQRSHSAVRVECAYLLNDDIINDLKSSARRGVETTVIIPNDEDHDVKIVRDAFNWVQNDVVRSGVRLYKYRGRMVHSKVASFDGRVATVGSSNLDDMALKKLSEANIFVTDRAFTRTLDERVFAADVPRSELVKVRKLGFWGSLKSGFLRLFRGFL